MALPTIKVELGFDLTDKPSAPFFRLDDTVQGRLDNTQYRLGGTLFYDVTEYVSAVNTSRGKDPIQTNYPPGEAEVQFNNQNRYFDPLYSASPYAGNIVPRREVRVYGNDIEIYRGWIDDWDLNYQNNGDSISIAKAFDALQLFNNKVVSAHTPVEQKSGARIEAILDRSEIGWPSSLRQIDDGQVTLAANPISEPINALQYLQSMAGSDPGDIYVTREGKFAFEDRTKGGPSTDLVSFGGTAIPFDNVNVTYGAELLFNEIVLTRQNGGTVTVIDPVSIDEFGVRSWNISDSQVSDDLQLVDIGVGLGKLYSRPQYRFSSIDIKMSKLSEAQQNQVLGLDFGDVCFMQFTPNNVGDAIEEYVEIVGIDHRIDVEQHIVTLSLNPQLSAFFVLDDAVFGKLDVGTLGW